MPPNQRLSAESNTNGVVEAQDVRAMLNMTDPDRPRELLLADLTRDPLLQPRAELNESAVQEYADEMRAGKKFPPGVVFDDGDTYWLVDGWHRVAAVEALGDTSYEFVVKQGHRRDALRYSLGVNDKHGLRRTNEDKRRAVQIALKDPEWQKLSSAQIATLCAVSDTFVDNVRRSVPTVGAERKSRGKNTEIRTTSDGRQIKVKNNGKSKPKKRAPKTLPPPMVEPEPEPEPVILDDHQLVIEGLRQAADGFSNLEGYERYAEDLYAWIQELRGEWQL